MTIQTNQPGPKRQASLSISAATEQGTQLAICQQMQQDCLDWNRDAIQSANDYVGQHGMPLQRFRQF